MNAAKLSEFKQDPHNLNKGTDSGNRILSKSIQELGLGRSILVDKNGFIIAGNKTAQAALNEGVNDAIVVPTSGDKVVVVQRTDLDLSTDPRAKQLAIADNRVAELNLEWDADALAELATEIDLEWLEIDDGFLAQLESFDEEPRDDEESNTKEIDTDDFEFDCKCPKCGFEFTKTNL